MLELLVTAELLCTVELLETLFDSLLCLADDSGLFAVEELEICVSLVLFVLGLDGVSSPQAEKKHAATKQLKKIFDFI